MTDSESPAAPPVGRPELLRLGAVLVLGLALRLVFLLLFADLEPVGDQTRYLLGARQLLAGEPYAETRGPGYSAFLALCELALGAGLGPARAANAALGLALAALLWALGRRLASPRAGLLAAVVVAVHPRYVLFPLYLLSENLYAPLLVLGVLLSLRAAEREEWRSALGAGAALGLAALTRDMLLAFLPVLGVALLLAGPRSLGSRSLGSRSLGRRARVAGAVVGSALLVIAPWTARNAAVHGRFLPIGFAEGTPLFLGNVQGESFDAVKEERRERARRYAAEAGGSRVAANDRLRADAWAAIRERQPTWILEKLASNGPELLQPITTHPEPWSRAGSAAAGSVSRALLAAGFLALHAALLLLAPLGAARWGTPGLALLLYLAYSFAVHVVSLAGPSRFQYAYEWVVVLAAATAAAHGLPPGRRRRALAALALALVLASQVPAGGRWADLARDAVGAAPAGPELSPP